MLSVTICLYSLISTLCLSLSLFFLPVSHSLLTSLFISFSLSLSPFSLSLLLLPLLSSLRLSFFLSLFSLSFFLISLHPSCFSLSLCLFLSNSCVQAVCRWAEIACLRRGESSTAQAQRAVLGEAIYSLRFPLMTPEEFANGPGEKSFTFRSPLGRKKSDRTGMRLFLERERLCTSRWPFRM